ncbi:MAG TPA: hypothetical protein VGQ24_01620, partial [Gemmatimonadales bacterium]|nr:hypothetical protein [Gemmatimonadales bacterium]
RTRLSSNDDDSSLDDPRGDIAGSPDGQPIAEPATLKFELQGVRRLRLGISQPIGQKPSGASGY